MIQHRLLGFALNEGGRLATAVGAIRRLDLPKKRIELAFAGNKIEREVAPVHLVVLDTEGNERVVDPDRATFQPVDTLPLVETSSEQILGVPRRLPSGAIVVPYTREAYPGYWGCIVIGGNASLYPRGGYDVSVPEAKLLASPALTPALN